MSAYRGFAVVMSLAAMTVAPALAAAQTPASYVPLPVAAGQKVWITTADGRVTKGKVLNLTPVIVEIGENGESPTSLAVADVRRIQVPDSVRNGVVKGALIGALVATLVVVGGTAVDITESLLSGDDKVGEGGDAGFYGSIAVGALLGYAIDKGNVKTVYERRSGGMTIAVSPIVSAAGKGVGVRVRW